MPSTSFGGDLFHLQSGTSPLGTAILRVSLIRLYLRIRSLAVLEVRDGDAFTYERKGTALFTRVAGSFARKHAAGENAGYRAF